jgi:hypothetical protein
MAVSPQVKKIVDAFTSQIAYFQGVFDGTK